MERHSFFGQTPFAKSRSTLAGFPRKRTLSFGLSLLLRVVFHTTPISSRVLAFCCTQSPLFTLLLPLDSPLPATAPDASISCLSRDEMRLTNFRFHVSEHNLFKSGVVSPFTLRSSIRTIKIILRSWTGKAVSLTLKYS